MDLNRLHEILNECTIPLRKGEALAREQVGTMDIVTINLLHPETAARPDLEKVDLFFITVGVDKATAEARKSELTRLLRTYPDPASLRSGPSYITVGGVLESQQSAFQLFAVGKVLGLWSIITPATFGMTGADAVKAAGSGCILISGFRGEDYPQ